MCCTRVVADDASQLMAWHLAAAGLHTLSFLVLVVLLVTGPTSSWAVTIPAYNGSRTDWEARYNLGWVLVSFPLLSTANHIGYVVLRSYHKRVLQFHTNPLRWAEYALSAGAMTWVIATLSGVTELRTLITLCILNAGLQYVGYLVESCHAIMNGPNYTDSQYEQVGTAVGSGGGGGGAKVTLYPSEITRVGWFIFLAMWLEIGMSFFSVLEYDTVQKPPDVVYAIVIVLFVLFSSFGALQLAYISGYLRNFRTYELGFIALSFVSKTVLTWMVYGGVINAGTNMRKE